MTPLAYMELAYFVEVEKGRQARRRRAVRAVARVLAAAFVVALVLAGGAL